MRAATWWVDRWRKSTAYTDMTLEQQGAYRNLLDELWLRDGVLPADDRILGKIAGDARRWPKLRAIVMARFVLTDAGWRNATHDEVVAGKVAFAESQAEKGRKRAEQASRGPAGAFQPSQPKHQPDHQPPDQPSSQPPNQPPYPFPVPPPGSDEDSAPRTERLSTGAVDPRALPPLALAWNRAVAGTPLPPVRMWSTSRATAAKARLRECDDLALWERAFGLIAASPHHRGGNDRGWVADLDFALQAKQSGRWLDAARNGGLPHAEANGKPGGGMTIAQILDLGSKP